MICVAQAQFISAAFKHPVAVGPAYRVSRMGTRPVVIWSAETPPPRTSSKMVNPRIECCIFDMDGLMLDSERIYTDVTNSVIAPKELTWEVKSKVMGMPAPKSARYLIDALNLPFTVEELLATMDKKLQVAMTQVKPLPGVVKLVHHLQKHNVPIAIATGSEKQKYLIKSEHLPHLFGPFGTNVIVGDDPILKGKGKPDPTIFIEAAKLLGFNDSEQRSHCLVFEDGAPGVRAARAAGMEVVWVPDKELVAVMGNDHDLEPSAVHETLEHFKPEDWGLPAYDS